jgi:hypothetical protein
MHNIIPFYVYKITCIPTGEFYYGSRYSHVKANREPIDDLWIHYFSSSRVVKNRIKKYGTDKFLTEITELHTDKEIIYWSEQVYIKNNIHNSLCLNRHFHENTADSNGSVYNQFGTTWWINKNGVLRRSKECPGPNWVPGGVSIGKKGWIKNGVVIFDNDCPGEDWIPGGTNKGKTWWFNKDGKRRRSVECPGPEWFSSDLKSWTKDGEIQFNETCPGDGWILGGPNKGKKYWVNQIGEGKYSIDRPGPEWNAGSNTTGKKWYVNQDGVRTLSVTSPGPEWIPGKYLPIV